MLLFYRERNDAVKKLSATQKDNLHLTKKVQRLQERLKNISANAPAEQPRPKRYHNVINLDSEDEDEDEQDDMVEEQNQNEIEKERREDQANTVSVESLAPNEERYSNL
jgi:hypothetical protein